MIGNVTKSFTPLKEASTRRTLTFTNKPRSLKRKLDYDDDEDQNTTDEEQQRMDTN
jgi:hypothetical protein